MKVKVKDKKNETCDIGLEMLDSICEFFKILATGEHTFVQKVTHTHTARDRGND